MTRPRCACAFASVFRGGAWVAQDRLRLAAPEVQKTVLEMESIGAGNIKSNASAKLLACVTAALRQLLSPATSTKEKEKDTDNGHKSAMVDPR